MYSVTGLKTRIHIFSTLGKFCKPDPKARYIKTINFFARLAILSNELNAANALAMLNYFH